MLPLAIDHLIQVVPGLEAAAAAYERLGLRLTPETEHATTGTANRVFFVANGDAEFYVELLSVRDRTLAMRMRPRYAALAGEGGPAGIALAVADLEAAATTLDERGLTATITPVRAADGRLVASTLEVDAPALGLPVTLIHYPEPLPARRQRHEAAGLFEHALPLARLDHLAAIVPALDPACEAWERLLGVPVAGEVVSRERGMIIRQLRIGGAILELIGPATPESPLSSRPPGLIPMAAFEVADIAAAAAAVRARGFAVPGPTPGPLPGTLVTSVPGSDLGGVTVQLLQYV